MLKRTQKQRKTESGSAGASAPRRSRLLQRKCSCGGQASLAGDCTECGGKKLNVRRQAKDAAEDREVPTVVHDVLRSPGQPLEPGDREEMESRFGYDFSQVRVHTDERAAESAHAVNAVAYTAGRDIVFGAEQYSPQTLEGKKLMSHELAHVVQQGSEHRIRDSLVVGPVDDIYERQADEAGNRVGGQPPHLSGIHSRSGQAVGLQRQVDPEAPTPEAPSAPGGKPGPALSNGQVVNVEIRDAGGAVTEFSHEYPIDLAGNIEIPTAGNIAAAGKTLEQLRKAIVSAFSPSILVSPTVNVSLSSKSVVYTQKVAVGDTLRIRVLGGDGKVDPSSGSYTVDSDGKLHIPFLGDIDVAGKTIAEIEDLIEKGIRNGFIINAVVHVSKAQLNS